MNSKKRFLWISIIFICLLACASNKLPEIELSIEREGRTVAVINVEAAVSDEEKATGLMNREELHDGKGMLFIYDRDQIMSFWMMNTLIPLSIAFIASDGRIIDIRDMYPHDETSVKSSRSVRYALEVPQGWFSRAGVLPGDIVKFQLPDR